MAWHGVARPVQSCTCHTMRAWSRRNGKENVTMTFKPSVDAPLRAWDGAAPLLMSLAVLLMIASELWRYGLHAHHVNDLADHLAQLLMFGQIPIMFWFAAPGRRRVRQILPTLALQLALWAITFALAVTLT